MANRSGCGRLSSLFPAVTLERNRSQLTGSGLGPTHQDGGRTAPKCVDSDHHTSVGGVGGQHQETDGQVVPATAKTRQTHAYGGLSTGKEYQRLAIDGDIRYF